MPYPSTVDITTNWADHRTVLKEASAAALDVTTLFSNDYATVIAATDERADRNTQYQEYFVENAS